MELQRILPELDEHGVALFAISYDGVEALAKFAGRRGITFPLLSDEGSAAITRLGLLNEHVFEQHEALKVPRVEEHWGVPYPGVFLLDEGGVVVDKRFFQSYRERETGPGLVEQALGVLSRFRGTETRAAAEAVTVRAWLDSPTFVFNQRLYLNVEIAIAEGYHLFGRPIPEGYVPLSVSVEPVERMQAGSPQWPPASPFAIAGLDEQFYVYEGTVRVSVPLTMAMRPGGGDVVIGGEVAFQACGSADCLPPARARFELPAEEQFLVDVPPPEKRE